MSEEKQLPHLRIARTEHETPRRLGGNPRPKPPPDLEGHARRLRNAVVAIGEAPAPTMGFDARRILKLEVQVGDPVDLERQMPGLSVVSQEGKMLTVLFATDVALDTFRARLEELETTGTTKYQQLLWNITDVADWSAEDRLGRVLRREGLPEGSHVVLDVELWPLDLVPDRRAMLRNFDGWCRTNGIQVLDSLDAATVVVFRVRIPALMVDELLAHRDVRLVDLPPRFGFDFKLLSTPIGTLDPISPPPPGAPVLAVLDTGVAGGHPLIAPALGDAQSFTTDAPAHDENGHGTHVCGLALYGDIETCVETGSFAPRLRLLSGRISDPGDSDRADTELLETRIKRAVEYFVDNYGCKVFVLTFCDERRPYVGGHVDRLASFLDELSRIHDVLFVVPSGNRCELPESLRWKRDYPLYLTSEDSRLLDPAPALNALTVASLARHEQNRAAQRHPKDPRQAPVARRDEPSPFSRSGPGPQGATKPDLVEYGGNYAVQRLGDQEQLLNQRDLGELSLSRDFAGGNLFVLDAGTSQAAPKVGHLAARLLERFPSATPDLLRALIVAHAEVPVAASALLDDDRLCNVVGNGKPRLMESMWSSERRVTMWAEEEIADDTCHFFELPIPADLRERPHRRDRRIVVALSHMPLVRRTRYDYCSSRMGFRIVRGTSMDEIARIFRKQDGSDDDSKMSNEPAGVEPSISRRKTSTVQRAIWTIKRTDKSWEAKPPFIVVTSRPPVWGRMEGRVERYALVVVIEDRSTEIVHLHSQVRALLRQRVRLQRRG